MTIFKDFAENGDLLKTIDEPVTNQNFPRYIQEYGTEAAKGYLDAINDMTKLLLACIEKNRQPYGDNFIIIYNSESIMRKKSESLYEEKVDFLEFANPFLVNTPK